MDIDGNMLQSRSKYEEKIKKVLEEFLNPAFKVKNDIYLNSLYMNILANAGSDSPINLQLYIEWLDRALNLWSTGLKPSLPVTIFTLNLAGFLVSNEAHFVSLQSFHCIDNLISIFRLNQLDTAQSLKNAYIKILRACLDHPTGAKWVLCTSYWTNVLTFILTHQTLYITEEGHKFFAKLILRSPVGDESLRLKVVEMIVKPLTDNSRFVSENMNSFFEINEEEIFRSLRSTLLLISEILEIILQEATKTSDYKLILPFIKDCNLEKIVMNYLSIAQTSEFIFVLSKVVFVLPFFEILEQMTESAPNPMTKSNVRNCISKMYKILYISTDKGLYDNVLKLCYSAHKYDQDLLKIESVSPDISCRFQHQMMLLEMMPSVCAGFRMAEKNLSSWEEQDDIRSLFADKIFKLISNTTVRTVFKWRESLFESPDIYRISCLALNSILRSRRFYSKSTATTAFQCLIYCFHDVVFCIKEKPHRLAVVANEVNFLSLLLENIAVFIEEYQLSWKDSVETICVMNVSFDFLSVVIWPPKVVVKALKLMEIAISKYMAPNLALLVDRTTDSTMAFIGPLLYAKLHDSQWEVRDSALEVLYTIAFNATTKFPSFRKLILESELTTLVVKMALHDGESFVRMTAVRCLQQMIVVSELWNDSKEVENLHDCMLRSILYETEGIVRKEVANLITKTYENQLFPHVIINLVYDTMCYASISDLHWEVKVNSLMFWEQVIKLHLQNQGMIDNSFPKQTFSKETRKIVTLTDTEIQKRLVKVLHQLSATGCLTVLMSAINDDCDLEVSKQAIRITQPFLDLLKKYGITSSENLYLSTPPSPMRINCPQSPGPSSPYRSPSFNYADLELNTPCLNNAPIPEFSESVLNEILDTRDMNLLQGVFNQDNHSIQEPVLLRRRKITPPKDFIDFTNQDLKVLIESRQTWIKSIDDFDSLLNDILQEYHADEVNNMDCY